MSSQAPITEYLGLLLVVLAGEAVSEGKVDRGIQLILYNKLREFISDSKVRTKQLLAEQFEKRKEFFDPYLKLTKSTFSSDEFDAIGN
jgi:hypothetical protein